MFPQEIGEVRPFDCSGEAKESLLRFCKLHATSSTAKIVTVIMVMMIMMVVVKVMVLMVVMVVIVGEGAF